MSAPTLEQKLELDAATKTVMDIAIKELVPVVIKEFQLKFARADTRSQCNALIMLMEANTSLGTTPAHKSAMSAFCAECIVKELGAELKLHDLLTAHKDWSKFNSGKKVVTKSQIIQYMTDTYGKPVDTAGKVWGGVRLNDE